MEQTTGETEEVPLPTAEYAGTWGDCAVRIGHERVVDVADIFEDDALSSFRGGDNIVASGASRAALDHVGENVAVELRIGVGRAETAAGIEAKHALEHCREENTVVRLGF